MGTTTKETLRRSSLRGSTAHYVFNRKLMQLNIFTLYDEFAKKYHNIRIAYSFKTNYLREMCMSAATFRCMAEVVSPYELKYARTMSEFGDENTIYNGVIPDPEGKFEVAAAGGMVNIDNIEEYRMLSYMAEKTGTEIKIGIRVTFDIENGVQSRFGVDIKEKEFGELLTEIRKDSYVSLGGFHCHIGSSRPVRYWKEKALIMAGLAKEYGAEYIDLGGGLYGPMPEELSKQFAEYPENFGEYASAVCNVMKKVFPDERVMLILEPGTALVGNTMVLVAEVVNIKKANGRQYITLNCNSNHAGFLCDCKDVPVEIIHENKQVPAHVEDAYIVGNTCLEFDYIRKNFSGDIALGDKIIVKNVGAYSLSSSRQFIVPRLATYDTDGNLLMEAETYEDMFKNYKPFHEINM